MAATNLFEELVDQYKIEQHLAEKRYTDLYRAYDVDEDRSVTLDVLRPLAYAEPAFANRFLARSKALAQIRHPNIPRIYDSGKTPDGRAYVAQALVEGYPLSQRLEQLTQRESPANSIYALKLIRQVAEALLLAERLNFRHYDLQPENVWLRNVAMPTDDTVLLLDLFVPMEANGDGSPQPAPSPMAAYLSPEQRGGKGIDSSSHVYSLGAMLFSLLSGGGPGRPVRLQDYVSQRVTSGPTVLERARSGLTRETYDLVDRSMRSDPARRFTTIEQFLTELDRALSAEEVNLRQGVKPAQTDGRRTWTVVIATLTLFVLLVAGLVAARGAQIRVEATAQAGRTRGAEGPGATVDQQASTPGTAVGALPPSSPTAAAMQASATPAAPTATQILPIGYPSGGYPPPGYPPSGDVLPALQSTATTPAVTATSTSEPIATETPTATPTIGIPQVRIDLNSVNLRGGPGLIYPQIGYLVRDDVVRVLARVGTDAAAWLLVDRGNGETGWLSVAMAEPVGGFALALVPTAMTIPPPPSPTATPTALPTLTPSATGTAPVPEDDDGDGEPRPTDEPQPTEAPPPTRTPPPFGTP